MTQHVAIGTTTAQYNPTAPFHPDARFPELPAGELASWNAPYRLFRELLFRLGHDRARYGTPQWNPLGGIIQPGQCVVLNPNFVLNAHPCGGDRFSVITHPSILRAVIDYVYVALRGEGRIVIADAPQMQCHWEALVESLGLRQIQQFYADRLGFDLELYDLRNFELADPSQPAYSTNRRSLPGDPLGSVVINLGRHSEFYGLACENYYGADYDRQETIRHHQGETQEYCVSKTILDADVYVAVPKMKVHKKVGVTMCLKGLVGINTNKNYLVHYRLGTPSQGGDQLPDGQARGSDRWIIRSDRWLRDHVQARQTFWSDCLYSAARGVYRGLIKPIRPLSAPTLIRDAGNWHGNDSAWRMTCDLAKILFFADREGTMRETPQRRMLSVIDGIIAGEKDGPLQPDAKPAGCLVVAENPIAADLVATRAMGFDIHALRQFDLMRHPDWDFGLRSADDIRVETDDGPVDGRAFFSGEHPMFGFVPHPGWVGHIEQGMRSPQAA